MASKSSSSILAELAISARTLSIQGDNVELPDKIKSPHPDVRSVQKAEIEAAVAGAKAAGGYVGNVLRSELLSVGTYVLPAGGTDAQKPHEEDEVYYAVRGRARFRAGSEDHVVAPG